MRILGWNCRGIYNSSTVRAFRALIRARNPSIIFLSETKTSDLRIESVACSIGFPNFVTSGLKGRAGGICLFWSNDVDVNILEFNPNTVAITIRDSFCSWSLIRFYDPPHKAKRRKAWVNLHALLESIEGPWLCFGDFNVVMDDSEKVGGKCGSSSAPNFLRDILLI